MPTLFQSIQGFAGASGVGILCLLGLFLIVSVFAENLPVVATHLLESPSWTAVATLPILVVAYVIGLLAIALVDRGNRLPASHISVLSEPPVAARYGQLEQEAEILSGSVVGFVLLGIVALLNAVAFQVPGSGICVPAARPVRIWQSHQADLPRPMICPTQCPQILY